MLKKTNLWWKIVAPDNLYQAFRKAAKGKRSKAAVAAFEYELESNIFLLHDELVEHRYHPGAYTSFYIHDPKKRLISAAPFRDRVVHHALCSIIEPIFERKFIFDTYANRPGKGTHRALDRCTQYMRRFAYVLELDVRQFFPSIDHAIRENILSETIQDEDILDLCRLILESGRGVLSDEYAMVYFEGDDLLVAARSRGLPIGNLTSQFWASYHSRRQRPAAPMLLRRAIPRVSGFPRPPTPEKTQSLTSSQTIEGVIDTVSCR
jgi:RNA-directed DNA polymerase